MRITFVLASGFSLSGGDRVIAKLAQELDARGHTVNLVSRPRRTPSRRERWKGIARGKRDKVIPMGSHFDELPMPRRVLERYRPVTDADVPDADVVIATWWETAEWVAALAPRKGAKAYLVQHHETFDYLPRARVAATYRLPLHKIVVAQWLVELMQREYGDACVSRIHLGIDSTQFCAPPRNKQAVPAIGFLYSSIPWKGAAVIAKALAQVRDTLPNTQVCAFGSEAPTVSLPLPPATEFVCCPPQAQLPALYASCDVWVCGSWSEGFTLPPMEAMACRCPVVATRVGGPDELIRKGVNGFLVAPGDSDALAARILRVLELDAASWRAMSEAAYTTLQGYRWENAADELEAVLRLAMERQNRESTQSSANYFL